MSSNEYALSLKTNRLVKKSTANYRKLKKLNLVREIPEPPPPARPSTPEPTEPPVESDEPDEPEFNERDLQNKMMDISTSAVKKNMKKIIKAQKLSDADYDILLKKMLYKKLCLDEPKKPKKEKQPRKKKTKFKIVEPSESSDSDSE